MYEKHKKRKFYFSPNEYTTLSSSLSCVAVCVVTFFSCKMSAPVLVHICRNAQWYSKQNEPDQDEMYINAQKAFSIVNFLLEIIDLKLFPFLSCLPRMDIQNWHTNWFFFLLACCMHLNIKPTWRKIAWYRSILSCYSRGE